MPLIAPYVEDFQKVLDERIKNIAVLSDELERLNKKVVIYTEGKTDVEYLKLAFAKFHEYKDIADRIEYYDIKNAKDTGDGELKKCLIICKKETIQT